MTRNDSDRARFGPFEVDLHTHEVWKFGTRLKLVGQPFEILAVLLSRPGELVTREELRTRLWPADTFVDFNHGLNAAVNKLREALSDSADAPRYVETLPRRGYRFVATVEWIKPEPFEAPATPTEKIREDVPLLPQAVLRAETNSDTKETIHVRRWPGFVIAFAAVLVLLIGGSFLLKEVSGFGASSKRLSPQRTRPLPLIGAVEPAFSPDGNSVAYVRIDGKFGERGIVIAPLGSDQRIQLTRDQTDCWPVWSPDGRYIAFSRFTDKQFKIHVIPADGGAAQKRIAELNPKSASYTASWSDRQIDTGDILPQRGELDWSPDGKSIAFAGASGIYLVSVENSVLQRLTEAPPMAQDWGAVFSPDGQKLLFVRNHQVGSPDEIWYASATGGRETRILSEPGRVVSSPQWSYDGRSIIYSSNRSGHPTLWRASIDAPDSVVQIKEAGSPAWDPAVSRRGYRMAYERLIRNLSVWQMDLSASGQEKHSSILIYGTSDTDQGPAPQFSPDGKKLAYMSDYSGTMEIWVSNRDGSSPFQLTAVGIAGTPRWSPDSRSIVFDTVSPSGSKILSISLRGGAPQLLTPDQFESEVPSWSHDGKWIYFASSRGDTHEVWKVPAGGGTPLQVTHQGGHAALESLDGKTLYYAKNAFHDPEIWQVPVQGGAETPLPLVHPTSWASWQVVESGILFVGPALGHQAVLSFYDVASQRSNVLAVLDRVPFWLGATTDGRTVAFDQPGQEQPQTMMVENFR
jgi:Tol biopolymer transport system component/DNA-binding winged helix-turn-helix (wHTH) protein